MEHTLDDLLDRLTGDWELTGQMGETPLRQEVKGRWILDGLFVEMRCCSVLPEPDGQIPYEAVYLIGYNAAHDHYLLHLFDTFGVAFPHVPGIGTREGDAITFLFAYESGPFTYRFAWDAKSASWSMEQFQVIGGHVQPFATKRMVRPGMQA